MTGEEEEYTGMGEEQRRAIEQQHEEEEEREKKKKAEEQNRRKNKRKEISTKENVQQNEKPSYKPIPRTETTSDTIRNGQSTRIDANRKKDLEKNTKNTDNILTDSPHDKNIQNLVEQIKAGTKPQQTSNPAKTTEFEDSNKGTTIGSNAQDLLKPSPTNLNNLSHNQKSIDTNGLESKIDNDPNELNQEYNDSSNNGTEPQASNRGTRLEPQTPNIKENNPNLNEMDMQGNTNKGDLEDMPDIPIDLGDIATTTNSQQSKRKEKPESEKREVITSASKDAALNRVAARQTAHKLENATNKVADTGRAVNNLTKAAAAKSLANRAAKTGGSKMFANMRGLRLVAKIGVIGSIIWVIVFILMVIGALAFFMNMPAVVLDNLKTWTMDAYDAVKGYITKQTYGVDLPTEAEVKQLATNMYNLGTDLTYWGFASEFTFDEKTKRVDTLKSKYLPVYLAAEQRNYMVANKFENVSIASAFKAIKEIFAGAENVAWGTGLLYIEEDAATLLKIKETSEGSAKTTIENKVSVDRRGKEMIINRNGWDSWFSTKGIEVYRFKLKYWLEKYATPLDFYLALHTATGAPELVYQLATNPSQGDGLVDPKSGNLLTTRVSISIAALEPKKDYDMEIVYLDIDPKTKKVKIGEDGLPQTLTVREIRAKLAAGEEVVGLTNNPGAEDLLKRAEAFDASNLMAFTPYVTKVVNHWYYREIIYQGEPASGTYLKPVNVYEVEDFTDNKPRVRYQMYESIQVPGTGNGSSTDGGSSGSSSSDPNGNNNSSGSGGNDQATDSGINFNPNEQSTGDDRNELAQNTQIAEDSGISSGGFFSSILDLINSVTGWIGSFGGITGMIFDLPSQILNNSYSSLANLMNGVMPSNLLGNISNGWLRGLGYYANGMLVNTTNIGKYLDFGQIGNTLGINKLQQMLSADNLMNSLGLEKVNSTLINISNLTNIDQIPGRVANALNVPELTGTFEGVTDMMKNGLTTDSLVNTMYSGFSSQMKDEFGAQVLNYAKIAFNGVKSGDAPTIATGIIGGLAVDLTDRTTNEFFDMLQNELTEKLDGQFDVQVEQLLQNENSKQLTGLTINELENMAQINNLDFNKIEEINNDLTKIKNSVDESTTASRELSNIVNKISEDYAGIDAVTFYYIAKTIREIFTELENATKQIDTFEALFNNYSLDERTELQIKTNIERARTAINNVRESIQSLEVGKTRTYGNDLSTAGSEIARVIETNKGKMNAVTASILIAQGNATSEILSTSGEKVQKIDVNTITKFKTTHPNITLDEFLKIADELALIDPTLNGFIEEIGQLSNELKDVNKENADEVLNKLNQYENNIDQIEWLTKSEINKLKTQLNTLENKVNNINNNINSANLNLINTLAGNITGITTYKIYALANQILNLPNTTINSLLNTVRQIPTDLVRQVSRAFSEKVAEAVAAETKRKLAEKVEEGLTETLNGDGQLTNALQTRTSNSKGEMDSEEQPLEGSQAEILTGFYIKETRYRDYMQKSEPILVPYRFEHWKKLLIDNKYILTGDYGSDYNMLINGQNLSPEDAAEVAKGNILENETLIKKYGTSIWEGTGGNLEETIYAQLQSMPSVDSQYLIRYFKELFATYGDELRAAAAKQNISSTDNIKHTIGWIFRTIKVTEIINTQTRETRIVDKSEYEPVSWTKNNAGTLYSTANDPVYGFKPGIDIVSPNNAVVVSKTEAKKNELGEKVLPTVTLQIKSAKDPEINGMRVIIKGGDFSKATIGSTVTKDQVIGTTTSDNIMILVLNKGSHAQVADVSQYVYPPYVTVNN